VTGTGAYRIVAEELDDPTIAVGDLHPGVVALNLPPWPPTPVSTGWIVTLSGGEL